MILLIGQLCGRLGLTYALKNVMNFVEAQEASEYDQPTSRINLSILKSFMMLSSISALTSSLPGLLILSGMYAWHVWRLYNTDRNVNTQSYNRYLKNFWLSFRLAFFTILFLESLFVVAPLAPVFAAITTFPFLMAELKRLVPPHTWYGRVFHHFDNYFGLFAQCATLVLGSQSLYQYLYNLTAMLSIFFKGVNRIVAYCSDFTYPLFFRLSNWLMRQTFIPQQYRDIYQQTAPILINEFNIIVEYMNRWRAHPRYTATEAVQIIEANTSLEPSLESLYMGERRGHGVNVPEQVTPESTLQKLETVLDNAFESRESFTAFLAQLQQEVPSYAGDILAVSNNADYTAQCLELLNGDRNIQQITQQAQDSPEPVRELSCRLIGDIESLRGVIRNPRSQLGAEVTVNDSDRIVPGLSNLFDKYSAFVEEAANCGNILDTRRRQERQEAALTNCYRLLARIFDKSLRCQGALRGLIDDEDSTGLDPLDHAWSQLLTREITRAYNRLIEMAMVVLDEANPGLPDQEREHLRHRMFLDPANVEHQTLIEMKCPGRYQFQQFDSFSEIVFQRHLDLFAFYSNHPAMEQQAYRLYSHSPSIFHHTFFPKVFCSQTAEEMVQITQRLYLIAKEDKSRAPWVADWEHSWQNYLNEAYPQGNQEMPQPLQCHAMRQRYPMTCQKNEMGHRQRLSLQLGGLKLPQEFENWNERQKREYFHQNKPLVRGSELDRENLLQEIEEGSEQAVQESCQCFVSREFSLHILLSKGMIETPQECKHALSRLGMIYQFHGTPTEERLQELGL